MVTSETAWALLILGISLGIALHRLLMALVLKASPDSLCAYCKWLNKKRSRHKK